MSITDKQGIEWLKTKLQMKPDSLRHSELYKVLRDNLTALGYWKRQPRGNPKKGFRSMVEQQRQRNNN